MLEYANKRNMKAIARWLLRRQKWNPFDREPYEFVELNFDFHPRWIKSQLEKAGLKIQTQRSVSHFRLGQLKRFIPTRYLVKLDSAVQPTGRPQGRGHSFAVRRVAEVISKNKRALWPASIATACGQSTMDCLTLRIHSSDSHKPISG